ncbi:unnamed protein product [Rhodiola kirilowii]
MGGGFGEQQMAVSRIRMLLADFLNSIAIPCGFLLTMNFNGNFLPHGISKLILMGHGMFAIIMQVLRLLQGIMWVLSLQSEHLFLPMQPVQHTLKVQLSLMASNLLNSCTILRLFLQPTVWMFSKPPIAVFHTFIGR